MKRADKAARIAAMLDEMYPDPRGPLFEESHYQLLVKVLLSAQCTDERVNQVSPGLFAQAATPEQMVELSVPTIRKLIKPCGLSPTKSKNIKALSQKLLDDHGGVVPQTFEELEALPGVGHKTASVVMGEAFGHHAFPVDTHIFRLAGRWGLSRARNVVEVERDLKKLFPPESWHAAHLQIIFFGREHCPARGHDFDTCPICSWAASKARAKAEARAQRRPRRATPARR